MRLFLCLLILIVPISGMAEVFRCDEPLGASMWSVQDHKVDPDKFSEVKPVVILGKKEMTVIWGDSKSAGGTEKVWKAIIFYRTPEIVSTAYLDESPAGSATMLYTLDIKRGYLYLSTHKDYKRLNMSGASSFVSKCK